MSFATIAGFPVISATITMPLVGLWRVEADVDAPEAFEGRVAIEAPGLSLSGTVVPSGDFGGRVRARIEAGAGRLAETLPGRYFRGATYRQIVGETLRDAGETLDASPMVGTAPLWCRASGPASRTVADVATALGLCWNTTDAGLLSLSSPTWAALDVPSSEVLDDDAVSGRIVLGTTDLSARPGRTIQGRRVVCVRHIIGDAIRTELLTEP